MTREYECDGSCVENDQSNEYPQTILSGFQTAAFIRCTELTPRPKPQDDDESETIPKASGNQLRTMNNE